MDVTTAEKLAKKTRALKHCDKVLKEIDKKGEIEIRMNNTGVTFIVKKNDSIYLRYQSMKFKLLDEIHSIEVTERALASQKNRRNSPAPVGAAPDYEFDDEQERIERQRAKWREYAKRSREKKKALKTQR